MVNSRGLCSPLKLLLLPSELSRFSYFKLFYTVSSAAQSPALETVVLPEDGFHSVYVSAVENPELFFVQLTSSEERLVTIKVAAHIL